MRGVVNYIEFNGKPISIRAWAGLWHVSYNTVICRWKKGIRDKWELIGKTGPLPFPISSEDVEYLRETRYARRGQEQRRGRLGRLDSEWEIACDLIGVPRRFMDEVKEAVLW